MSRINLLILFAGLILFSCTHSKEGKQPVWNNSLSVEANIAAQALAFDNDSTFPFLDEIMKNRSVIILGEAGHDDTTSHMIRMKMTEYLLDRGFNSIALEGGSLISFYVYSNPKYKDYTKAWYNSFEAPNFSPIKDLMSEKKIKIWGIDVWAGSGSMYHDIDAVKIILKEYMKDDPVSIDWDSLAYLYHHKFVLRSRLGKLSAIKQIEMMRMIDAISNYTLYLIHKKGRTNDLSAVMQWIRNVNTNWSFSKIDEEDIDIYNNVPITTFPFRNRDSQMAENIIWITEHFPEEKFVVHCANYHGAKDISQSLYKTDSLMYFIHQCAGEGVYNKLGDKMYSLAFTSLNYIGRKDMPAGLLEEAIAKETNNAPYAFVDFESLRFASGFRDKEFDAAMIKKKRGKWLYIFDGIYYIRDQEEKKVRVLHE